MIESFFKILVTPIVLALSLAGFSLSPTQEEVPEDSLGAALPQAVAVFETSLASPMSAAATSMTLTANAIRGGGALSGYNCFTIDEGSAQAEVVCGSVSGTAVTGLSRGISQSTGTTTVSALQFAHRRGASVKITDYPIIQILKAQNSGEDTFENPIRYASGVSTTTLGTNEQNLASVAYANSLSFGAIPAASETASGFVELGTGVEIASSTSSGSAARLVIPASLATSTYNSATAGSRVVVTQPGGKIDPNFITITEGSLNLGTTTQIGDFNAWDGFFKQKQIITTTGTSTFNVPSGVTKLWVEVQGAGGGGGGSAADLGAGEGGGAGGYAQEIVDVSATSSFPVYVGATGADGQRTTFGTIGIDFLSCTGGAQGDNSSAYAGPGGAGGTCTGGDINIAGEYGDSIILHGTTAIGAPGANSRYGTGGVGPSNNSDGTAGGNASGYGAGGGGCNGADGNPCSTGAGTQGIIIVRW